MLDDALQNLRNLPNAADWHRVAGRFEANWGDSYEPSRILLPDLIYRTGIVHPVALMPVRNSLLVCSAHDESELAAMLARADALMNESPRWLSVQPLELVDGQWRPFELPLSVRAAYEEIAAREAAEHYGTQKQMLDELHDKRGLDVFVASLAFVWTEGRIKSSATWTKASTPCCR